MENKKVNKQCQCDDLFARVSGLIMTLVGGLGLVLAFISKGLTSVTYLHTEIQGAGINLSTFENEMSWEVIMREVVRLQMNKIKSGFDLVFFLSKGFKKEMTLKETNSAIENIFKKINLYLIK